MGARLKGLAGTLASIARLRGDLTSGAIARRSAERWEPGFVATARSLAPQPVTGELNQGIGVETKGNTIRAVSRAPHSSYVELGTFNSAAQPYLEPAVNVERAALLAIIRDEIKRKLP